MHVETFAATPSAVVHPPLSMAQASTGTHGSVSYQALPVHPKDGQAQVKFPAVLLQWLAESQYPADPADRHSSMSVQGALLLPAPKKPGSQLHSYEPSVSAQMAPGPEQDGP
jgi:hypothetical protein